MALSIYTKACAKNIAGNNAVLVTEASNIDTVTVDGSGEITGISMVGGATFKQLQADQDSIVRVEEAAGSDVNISYTHSVQMGFAKGSVDLNTLRDSLAEASPCGIVAIVQDSNGKSWMVGYNELDKLKRALRLVTDSYTSGNSPADEDVQKADIILESLSGYPDLPLSSSLNTSITNALLSGGGTAIEWSPGYSAEYQAVYDAMTTKPSTAIADAQNTLVEALKTAGVWSKLDVFYLFAQTTNGDGEAEINWVDPGTYDAVTAGSLAFTALEGFQGNNIDAALRVGGYDASLGGVNYTQDDAGISFYSRIACTSGDYYASGSGVTGQVYVQRLASANQIRVRFNSSAQTTMVSSSEIGTFSIQRDGAASTQMLHNKVEDATGVDVSTAVAEEIGFFARWSGALFSDFADPQLSMGAVHSALTKSQHDSLHDAIEAYMDSNGKGVVT